jgi:hypothetical protein
LFLVMFCHHWDFYSLLFFLNIKALGSEKLDTEYETDTPTDNYL